MGRTRWGWLEDQYQRATKRQAYVLDWRRTPAGWEAEVVWRDEAAERTVIEWVPAARLTAVEVEHPHLGTAYG